MKIKLGSGIIPVNLLAWLLILIIVFFPSNTLRIILGIPFVLFLPGYSLMASIFVKKGAVSSTERLVLSSVLSIAIVGLIGLILNYTPWGIKLESVIYSAASFILITSIIAWLRQERLTKQERFAVEFQIPRASWGEDFWARVFTFALVISILGALGTLGYVIATPRAEETFTDFYILGEEGKAADYPSELKVGDEGKVQVGIVNHEGKEVTYRVELVMGSQKIKGVEPVVLVDKQKWEGEVSFVPAVAGENQKLELLLYKEGGIEPYLEPLYLRVDVVK